MHSRAGYGGLLAVAATLLASLAAPPAAAAPPPIVGGRPASQTYSFMVSLQSYYGTHDCGASLVSPTWLVTAAHCGQPDVARIGTTRWQSGGEVIPITERRELGGDLALLRLASPAAAAPVPIADSAPVGSQIRLLGWGQTCPTYGCGGPPDVLQQLDTSVLDDSACRGHTGASELCVDSPEGRSACWGDSGGPAITGRPGAWQLVGATSGGTADWCGGGPAIYMDVPAFKTQIESIVQG